MSRAPHYFLKLVDYISLHRLDKGRLARGRKLSGTFAKKEKKRKEANYSVFT